MSRFENLIPNDWEMRFTEEGGQAALYSETGTFGDPTLIDVPFELWRIGTTPDDPSDDVRYFPTIFDLDNAVAPGGGVFSMLSDAGIQGTFDCCSGDSEMSGATNDPYSDGITWVVPEDLSPGQAGYEALVSAVETDPAAANTLLASLPIAFRRMALVAWNAGDVAADPLPYDQFEFPEVGTVFRIITTKPLESGDEFVINTADFAPVRNADTTAVASMDLVGIVPNPYRGASAYETSVTSDVVRFTNLPDQATIRVYTLAGTLVRTMTLSTFNNEWDLKTDSGLDIASGMYLIHVDVPGVGEKVLKFGVVKKRIQLDLF